MGNSPRISVIITTYNGEKYIENTIQSILDQTYSNFEIIIVDDCSKDDTVKKIRSMHDERIRLLVNDTNSGSFYGLTRGLAEATGEYIARTDQDDISYTERFANQIEYMDSNPEVFLCGCRNDLYINGVRKEERIIPVYTCNELAFSLLFGNFCFIHSSFFFRRQEAIDKQIKYEKYRFAEDYHFLLQSSAKAKIGKINSTLVGYRIHEGQYSNWEPLEDEQNENEEMLREYGKCIELSEHEISIVVKAKRRNLVIREDFSIYSELYHEQAERNGLDIKKNKQDRICAKYIFQVCMMQQKRNRAALKAYVYSGLIDWKFLLSYPGICYIGRCILTK